jgi:hypothetical protein
LCKVSVWPLYLIDRAKEIISTLGFYYRILYLEKLLTRADTFAEKYFPQTPLSNMIVQFM